jgi:NADH:ubiquinone oxidoreductase subunit E
MFTYKCILCFNLLSIEIKILGQRFRPEYCTEFSCLMKSTQEHYAYCKQDLSIQHGGRDEHTKSIK